MTTELPPFEDAEISARRTTASPVIRCLVVDDHPAIRRGLIEP